MKKAYTLDYDIESEADRLNAIRDILDTLPRDPNTTDLEQMATYILCGKDEDGYNAIQRGEIYLNDRRYNSFRRKDDKLQSLDAILENPLSDQQDLQPATKRDPYLRRKPTIARPKYDRKTGELLDPGDSDIPGMQQLWDDIDHMERWIHVLEGKLQPRESDLLFENPYRLYQLKHTLIDMRRHQYYLKDAYKPVTRFLAAAHPRPQFIDWASDSFYWIPLATWQERVDNALLHTISRDLSDYETRTTPGGEVEVKWIVQRHTFDWENYLHVRALIDNYQALYDYLYDKLNTSGRTLIFDFERYRTMAHFTEVREWLLDQRIAHSPYPQILHDLQVKYGISYNENHLSTILAREIPQAIATAAAKHRSLIETPESQCKVCHHCGQLLPRNDLFFTHNRSRRDGFSSSCKDCEKIMRIARGQGKYDKRSKEAAMYAVQADETAN